jgi:hypothetical protein
MLGGMIGWAVLFTLFYGGASLVCTPPVSAAAMSGFRLAGGVATAVCLFALIAGAVLWRQRKATALAQSLSSLQAFMANSTAALAIAGLIAAVWLAVPVLMFSDCRG